MDDLKHKLDIVNSVLARYNIEPITEADVIRFWNKMNTPDNSAEARRSFDDLWQRIREREQQRQSVEASGLPS